MHTYVCVCVFVLVCMYVNMRVFCMNKKKNQEKHSNVCRFSCIHMQWNQSCWVHCVMVLLLLVDVCVCVVQQYLPLDSLTDKQSRIKKENQTIMTENNKFIIVCESQLNDIERLVYMYVVWFWLSIFNWCTLNPKMPTTINSKCWDPF